MVTKAPIKVRYCMESIEGAMADRSIQIEEFYCKGKKPNGRYMLIDLATLQRYGQMYCR